MTNQEVCERILAAAKARVSPKGGPARHDGELRVYEAVKKEVRKIMEEIGGQSIKRRNVHGVSQHSR